MRWGPPCVHNPTCVGSSLVGSAVVLDERMRPSRYVFMCFQFFSRIAQMRWGLPCEHKLTWFGRSLVGSAVALYARVRPSSHVFVCFQVCFSDCADLLRAAVRAYSDMLRKCSGPLGGRAGRMHATIAPRFHVFPTFFLGLRRFVGDRHVDIS